jgi:hypothetical protein
MLGAGAAGTVDGVGAGAGGRGDGRRPPVIGGTAPAAVIGN